MSNELDLAVPRPMAALTQRVISPQNIALETRQHRAMPLSASKRNKIKAAISQIERRLKREQYAELRTVYSALKDQLSGLHDTYTELKARLAEEPESEELRARYSDVRETVEPLMQRWRVVKSQLQPLHHAARQRATLMAMLEDHPVAVARIKAEQQLRKDLEREAAIYADIIINKWSQLGFKHEYSVKGKTRIKRVRFANASITLDAIYLKIESSTKTAFGGWRDLMPDGVYIGKDLLSEYSLTELSIACQRQVTGVYNAHGAWVIVHRLESVDGLMNYVAFGDVMSRYPQQYQKHMPIPVGVSYNREIQWANLADYPHWLIGGYTGSGKSNAINNGICSLIRTQSPEDLRIVLCDLKGGLEFSFYKDIPHLHGEIVSTVQGVAEMLMQLEAVMEYRFKLFKGAAKKIEDFHLSRPGHPMPRVLCVFDEVASIHGHGSTTKDIEASLLKITRLGRAVGVHMWLCTQQPDAHVIPTGIKTNCPLRMSGRMPTSSASVTILGNSSAAALAAVAGRMILQYGPDPMPIQTPHITDDEIEKSLTTARAMPKPVELETGDIHILARRGWNAQMLISFSLTHMDGLVSGRRLWEAIGDDTLSLPNANKLAEEIWKMAPLEHEGKTYAIEKRRGGARYLVEKQAEDTQIQDTNIVSNHASLLEPDLAS